MNEKEKLKKLKEKEKLKKLKEKEKLKKLKEKEKLKEKMIKNRKKKFFKGGMMTTRAVSNVCNFILQSWVREDDADDYFEMFVKSYSGELFSNLNYNMLTELQILKDLIYTDTKKINLDFHEIQVQLSEYSFMTSLMKAIDDHVSSSIYTDIKLDKDQKIILFYSIIKNLIDIYIKLSKNLFNTTIFPPIKERKPIIKRKTDEEDNKIQLEDNKIQLFRSWRRQDQLNSIKSRYDPSSQLLITDNFLSTSTDKQLALEFYHNSSTRMQNFTLWQIDIPDDYPNLHVCHELKEVLLHIGAKLKYIGVWDVGEKIYDTHYNYKIEKYEYKGFCNKTFKETINKYKTLLSMLESFIKKKNVLK